MKLVNQDEVFQFVIKNSLVFGNGVLQDVITAITPHGIIVGFRDVFSLNNFDVAITDNDGVVPQQLEELFLSGKRIAFLSNGLKNPIVWFLTRLT